MKKRYKIPLAFLVVLAVAFTAFALVLNHDSPCEAGAANDATGMQVVVRHCYGTADVVLLERAPKPQPADNQLLVRVRAAAVNPLDWHVLHGTPTVMRLESGVGAPHDIRLGVDFAGTVEAVGAKVTQFKPGDEVFGGRNGAFAEYLTIKEDGAVTLKPTNISIQEAAAVPIAAVTALQALRDQGHLQPGQKVLVNGASGGVGTYAVQIAKALGAEVTGVCSARNAELVLSLGADHVIDYQKQDYTGGAQRFDLILDAIGNHGILENRRVLNEKGVFVIIGGASNNRLMSPLEAPIKAMLLAPFMSQKAGFFVANLNQQDLQQIAQLLQSGKIRSVIDRSYPLAETAAAIRYIEEGHARGKVVIALE